MNIIKSKTGVFLLAFFETWAIKWMIHMPGDKLGYTNSVFSVGIFLIFSILFYKIKLHRFSNSTWMWSLIFGFIFSISMIFGTQLDIYGNVNFTNIGMWIAILMNGIVFSLCARYFWDLFFSTRSNAEKGTSYNRPKINKKRVLQLTLLILVLYIPLFLAEYPGFFVYDAFEELNQVATRNFSAHHPLVHVVLLGGIIQAVHKVMGSYNAGIAIYTVFQMTVLACIYAWCTEWLRCRGLTKKSQIALCIYFGICPVIAMFSLCTAKDGIFTGLLMIFFLMLKELSEDQDDFWKNKWQVIGFILSAAGMMLFRKNAVYAFIVFIPFLILNLKKYIKKTLLSTVIAIIIFGIISGGLITVLHADKTENQEILTVPIMQIARVHYFDKDRLSQEELQTMYHFLSEDTLEKYNPKLSDPVKIGFQNEYYSKNKAEFFQLWFSLLKKYPATYLNAWFMTSYGFWYPDTVIDVYKGNQVFTFQYQDSSYFGYEVEQPGYRDSKIPWLDNIYKKISLEIYQQKVPVISMLFSPGFLFMILLFGLGGLCYIGKYKKAMPYAFLILYWLTLIIGPTYLVRYVVFLWTVLPIFIIDVCDGKAGN